MSKVIKLFVIIFMISLISITYVYATNNTSSKGTNNTFQVGYTNQLVYLDKLSESKGTGAYKDFKQLHGYPLANKFTIYFKGTVNSFQTTVVDLRKLNLNESITWKYNGKIYKNTRKQLYNFFNNISLLESKLHVKESVFNEKWFQTTFPKVYQEWFDLESWSYEASSIVEKYLYYKSGVNFNNRYDTSGFDQAEKFINDWISKSDLMKYGISFIAQKDSQYVFLKQGVTSKILYTIPFMTSSFIKAKNTDVVIFSGIKMQIIDGTLYFYKQNLIDKVSSEIKNAPPNDLDGIVSSPDTNNTETEGYLDLTELKYSYKINFIYSGAPEGKGFYDENTWNKDTNYYKLLYSLSDMTVSFFNAQNATATFNEIQCKKAEGKLYFKISDLNEKGIIKQ